MATDTPVNDLLGLIAKKFYEVSPSMPSEAVDAFIQYARKFMTEEVAYTTPGGVGGGGLLVTLRSDGQRIPLFGVFTDSESIEEPGFTIIGDRGRFPRLPPEAHGVPVFPQT